MAGSLERACIEVIVSNPDSTMSFKPIEKGMLTSATSLEQITGRKDWAGLSLRIPSQTNRQDGWNRNRFTPEVQQLLLERRNSSTKS